MAQNQVGISGAAFAPGDRVVINPGGANQEIATVHRLGSLVFTFPLQFDHAPGEPVAYAGPANPNADSDGDGLSNAQELALGTNPDASDTDADGLPDGVEKANGFSPTDPKSGMQMTDITITPGGLIRLAWNGHRDREYDIEASSSLTSGDWEILGRFRANTGLLQSAEFTNPYPGAPSAFFRVGPVLNP